MMLKMRFQKRFPLLSWFLTRSFFYYAILVLLVMGSLDFYLWHYLRLLHVQSLYFVCDERDPYSAIRYYGHLARIGGINPDEYKKLAESYSEIGDNKEAQRLVKNGMQFIPSELDAHK